MERALEAILHERGIQASVTLIVAEGALNCTIASLPALVDRLVIGRRAF